MSISRKSAMDATGSGIASSSAMPDHDLRPAAKPLYQQVKEHLIRRVLQGEWKPGECLPSETKLAEAYGFSQGTVRKAIEELADENLVTRHAGRGTFVRSHKGDYKPFRFHRFCADTGGRLTDGRMDYIRCTTGRASVRAAKALQIAGEAEVADVERLRFLEDRPVLLERITLGTGLCAGIEKILDEQKPSSIYLVLEQHYNILIVRVDESIRARLSRPDEEAVLKLVPGTPVLEAERVAYSLGGEPVEWRLSVGHTGNMHYWNQTTG